MSGPCLASRSVPPRKGCGLRSDLTAGRALRTVRQEQNPAETLELIRTSQSPITTWLAGQFNPSIQLLGLRCLLLLGVMYFLDKGTNRRVMLVGLMFCAAFVLVSFFARPQPENDRVLVKADRLTLTAGKPPLAN
jgi:hypothetical protein